MNPLLPLCLLVVSAIVPAMAQAPVPPAPPVSDAILRCTLPGGTYSVAVRSIVSVSTHEYLGDGGIRVTELNIDTTGSLLSRFYYLEPAIPSVAAPLADPVQERAQQLLGVATEKVGADAWKKVIKNYPTTTHARTVEYRLTKKEQIKTLFEAAEASLRSGEPRSVKVE